MSDYTIEPGANEGSQAIWRHAGQTHFPLAYTTDTDPEIFRAAAAVLAPDDDVHTAIRRAVSKVATENGLRLYEVRIAMADAVLAALKQHATGGDV